jgi:hypothetical protein
VALLHEGPLAEGEHSVEWNGVITDGTPAPSGVYFITLSAGTRMLTQRVVLQR